jgi:hypothetical protein
MAEKFNLNIIIIIRHPAAFVSSIKKLKWSHPFSHFLDQRLLIENLLGAFETEIREYAAKEQDLINQGILLWKLIHFTILSFQREHENWIFIRHEDISRNPLHGFKELFSRLGMEFTESCRAVIEEYSSPGNPVESDAPVGSEAILKRHSQLAVNTWKNRLSTDEVKIIRRRVEEISSAFYSENEW